MLISFLYLKSLGRIEVTGLYRYQYKITDSEFGNSISEGSGGMGGVYAEGICSAVINEYEKRGLPVVINLIKCMLFTHKISDWQIEDIITYNKIYTPGFSKYEKDIEKYLLLI